MYLTREGFKMTKEEHEDFARFCAKNDIEKLKKQIGKYVMVQCRNDGDERVYLKTFEAVSDVFAKDGWWNTFTLSDTKNKKGLYFAKIKDFRIDRNGFLNMLVTIEYSVSGINPYSEVWSYFRMTKIFAKDYMKALYYDFNEEALERHFEKDESMSDEMFAINLLRKFIEGEVSEEEILKCLHEPTDKEKEIRSIIMSVMKNDKKFEETYPRTTKKLKVEMDKFGLSYELAEEWLIRKEHEFCRMKLGDENLPLAQKTELVCLYWEAKKMEEKAAKKAARKAKKNEV